MPYIKQERRQELNQKMQSLLDISPTLSSGDLNYIISNLLNTHLNNAVNYEKCNSVVGILECAKLEFYNKLATPYENVKIAENGGLYKDLSKDSEEYIMKKALEDVNSEITACRIINSNQENRQDIFQDNLPILREKAKAIEFASRKK